MKVDESYLISGSDVEHVTALDVRDRGGVVGYKLDKSRHKFDFQPFMWIEDDSLALRFKHSSLTELKGEGLKYLVHFATTRDFYNAKKALYNINANYIALSDLQQQFMIATGITMFKGMAFKDLRVMQFDIETLKGVATEDNEIACIGIKQGNAEGVITGTQEEIINKFVLAVRKGNPHVIETYNGENFDWKVIKDVAARCRIPLTIGTNGEEIYTRKCNIKLTESQNVMSDKNFVTGRHLVDLYYSIRRYNVTKRVFDSFGLKEVVKTMGMVRDDRTFVDGKDIAEVWKTDPDRIKAYCQDDCRDLKVISDLLLPLEFYQCQIFPIALDRLCIAGTANKINSLFYRYHYYAGQAIPIADKRSAEKFEGGLVLSEASGVFRDCLKIDVSSMYPTIMLTNNLNPKQDGLKLFSILLKSLTEKRLEMKQQLKTAKGDVKEKLDALQNAYKIIINSFFGLSSSNFSPWSDLDLGKFVTSEGRRILQLMIDSLKKVGFTIITADSDGIIVT